MHIYRLNADLNRYETLRYRNQKKAAIFTEYGKQGLWKWWEWGRFAPNWTPVELVVESDPRRSRPFPVPDITLVSACVLILYKRGREALDKYLTPDACEILPLICANRDLACVHVTRVIDALTPSCEVAERMRNGDFMAALGTEGFAFVSSAVRNMNLFRIPEMLNWHFVSDGFVRTAVAAELKGFDFQLVWSAAGSEPPPAIPPHLRPKPPREAKPRLAPALGTEIGDATGLEPMLGKESRAKSKRKPQK